MDNIAVQNCAILFIALRPLFDRNARLLRIVQTIAAPRRLYACTQQISQAHLIMGQVCSTAQLSQTNLRRS